MVQRTPIGMPHLLAIIVTATFSASLSHNLLVEHAPCATHGDLTHIDSDGDAPRGDSSTHPGVTDSDASLGHDHCDHLATRDEPALNDAPAPVLPRSFDRIDDSLGWADRTGATSVTTLALAPKHSPPLHSTNQ